MPIRTVPKPKPGVFDIRNLLIQLAILSLGYLFAQQLSPHHTNIVTRIREAVPSIPNSTSKQPDPVSSIPALSCIHILPGVKSHNFSDFIRLNQPALLLASYYNTKLSLPKTGLDASTTAVAKLFDKCTSAPDDAFPQKCVLRMTDVFYNYCPPSDCHCMGSQFYSYLQQLVQSNGCSTVGIANDGFRRLEFSGCLSILPKYLGGTNKAPKWQYDAIHYRKGDFKNTTKERTPQTPGLSLWLLLKQFCILSDRDIVVLLDSDTSDADPELPVCGGRVVLARVGAVVAMQIMQHARFVSAGTSDVGHAMMEFARPERVIVEVDNARKLEYVRCENWTVVDVRDGATFHFESRAYAMETVSSTRVLQYERKFRKPEKLAAEEFEMGVPRRRWGAEMMAPAVLRGM